MKFLLFLTLALVVIAHTKEIGVRSYNGYQVITVVATNEAEAKIVKDLFDSEEYDFWTSPRKLGATDIMTSPEQLPILMRLLVKNGMKHEVKIDNVETLVQEERESNKRGAIGRVGWTAYPRFAQIEDWLSNDLVSPYAEVSVIGQSFEGRNIHVVKFSKGGASKKSVLIDANIHAREWISGATATWIINELDTNMEAQKLLDDLDIYIIPMINVDGYEFAHTNDRMWRKTRSVRSGSACVGCDPNRNFGFQFAGESTSPSPCSDIYHGPQAFSEPETAAVRDFVMAREAEGVNFLAYMTFHSYSQVWLLPWGYTQGVYPPDFSEQLSLGQAAIAALRAVSGTVYETGQGADLLYGVGGASDDWAKDHGIKYTATIEMRDTGRYGFLLPADQIIPNAKEVWAGLQEVFKRVIATKV